MKINNKRTKKLVVFSLIAFSTVLLGAAAVLVKEALHASESSRDAASRPYESRRYGR